MKPRVVWKFLKTCAVTPQRDFKYALYIMLFRDEFICPYKIPVVVASGGRRYRMNYYASTRNPCTDRRVRAAIAHIHYSTRRSIRNDRPREIHITQLSVGFHPAKRLAAGPRACSDRCAETFAFRGARYYTGAFRKRHWHPEVRTRDDRKKVWRRPNDRPPLWWCSSRDLVYSCVLYTARSYNILLFSSSRRGSLCVEKSPRPALGCSFPRVLTRLTAIRGEIALKNPSWELKN